MKIKAKRYGWTFFWLIWCIVIFFWIFQLKEEYLIQTNDLTKHQKETFFSRDFFSNPLTIQGISTKVGNKKEWILKIPKIQLKQTIEEGTSQAVLKKAIGHFSETPLWNGNVGLAAHNRNGGEAGFFRDIKNLKIGDEIEYQKDGKSRKYYVIENLVISETDWSYLEPSKENRITLITCEEGFYEYRRCIQAIEEGGILNDES